MTRLEPHELHGNVELPAWTRLLRRQKLEAKRVGGLIDAEPGKTERAARQALGGRVERPMHEGEHIGARPPAGLDRHLDIVVAGTHIDRLERLNAFIDDSERRRPDEFRGEMDLRRVPRIVRHACRA